MRTRVRELSDLISLAKRGGVLFRTELDMNTASLTQGAHTYLWRRDWDDLKQAALRQVNAEFDLDLDPDTLSPSQVSRCFSKQVLLIPTIPHGKATLPMAWEKSGENWHYLSLKRYRAPLSWELDISSAYFSYLLASPSPYFLPGIGYKPKQEIRQRLHHYSPLIPKLFRLMLFGFWAGSGFTGEVWKGSESRGSFQKIRVKKVYNALLYNACHHAMYNLKNDMAMADKQLGLGCIRCHTDSFVITPNTSFSFLLKAFSPFRNRGIKFNLKGEGKTYLLDINTGIVAGRKTLHPEYFFRLPHKKLPVLPSPLDGEGIDRKDIDLLLDWIG